MSKPTTTDLLPRQSWLGIDQNGRPVLNGKFAFHLVDTIGFPLDLLLQEVHDRGCVIDWTTLLIAGDLNGWKTPTLRARIEEALRMVYRGEADQLVGRLNSLIAYLGLEDSRRASEPEDHPTTWSVGHRPGPATTKSD